MEVQMVAKEFSLTPSLQHHLERQVGFAFGRARSRVARIVVRLRDLNGPRGGADKLCQVSVVMPGRPQLVVSEVREDMYHAIDSAIKRAAYRAMRLMRRQRAKGKDSTLLPERMPGAGGQD